MELTETVPVMCVISCNMCIYSHGSGTYFSIFGRNILLTVYQIYNDLMLYPSVIA